MVPEIRIMAPSLEGGLDEPYGQPYRFSDEDLVER